MSNFREDILEAADGEEIEAIVIGGFGDWGKEDSRDIVCNKNRLMPWAEAAPLLGYGYDTGFGGADCHCITAWTKTRVLFVAEYDGSTNVSSVPRNPIDHKPGMV